MKTVLIIYVISWSLLLCLYAIQRLRGIHMDNDKDNYGIYIAIFLLAPIMLVAVIFIITSSFVQDKKRKKKRMEYEEKAKKEKEYKLRSKAELNCVLVKKTENGSSSVYAQTAHNLMDSISSRNGYQGVMQPLKHLSMPIGLSLQVEKCKEKWPGDQSKLLVETAQGTCDYQIWDYIQVDDSEEGAWEAYLLFKLWHSLPMFQHALYSRRTYIYSYEDISEIECMMDNESTPIAQSASKKVLIAPQVVKAENKYFVLCCYWSNFGGLIQETVEVTLNGNKVSFKDIEQKTLYQYECGIMF